MWSFDQLDNILRRCDALKAKCSILDHMVANLSRDHCLNISHFEGSSGSSEDEGSVRY